MYKHTKFFVKRQAESGIFYPICIIGPPLRPRRHPFAGNSPRRAVPAAGCPPLRPSRPAPDGVPSDQTAFPSLTSGPPFSQRAPLFFRPSDLPSHNDRAISHPDERLLSLTNIHPSLLPGSANIQDKRAAAKQKAGAESAGMESTGMESTGTESAGAERRRGGNCRNGKCRNGKCRNGKCRNGKCRNEEKA